MRGAPKVFEMPRSSPSISPIMAAFSGRFSNHRQPRPVQGAAVGDLSEDRIVVDEQIERYGKPNHQLNQEGQPVRKARGDRPVDPVQPHSNKCRQEEDVPVWHLVGDYGK